MFGGGGKNKESDFRELHQGAEWVLGAGRSKRSHLNLSIESLK